MSPYAFTNVLVPVDGSAGAGKALDCALSVCGAWGARLTALAVAGRLPAYAASLGEVDSVKREKEQFFTSVLEDARRLAESRDVEVTTDLVPGHAAEVITHYARAHGHDLIVIGHRGHFMGDYLLGSSRPGRAPCTLPRDGGALMLRVHIPGRGELGLEHVVLDLNGTLSDRGALIPDVVWRLQRVGADMRLHLLTADTYRTANGIAAELGATLHLVSSGEDKRAYVEQLGAARCVAIGNGVNDVAMLQAAGIGIAVFGPEGTSFAAMAAADVVCRSAQEALDLLLSPLVLTATLRP